MSEFDFKNWFDKEMDSIKNDPEYLEIHAITKYMDAIGDLNLCVGNVKDNPRYLVDAVKWQMNERRQLSWLRDRMIKAIEYTEDEMMTGYKDYETLLREIKRILDKTKPKKSPKISDYEH